MSKEITWEELALDEWVNPEEQESRDWTEQIAQKYHLTPLQVSKIKCAVWWGTYKPQHYAKPEALSKVREVALEVGNDEAIKGVIQDYTQVRFEDGIAIDQALQTLSELLKEQHRRAVEGVAGALREVFPDATIVDTDKMSGRIEKEFKE